MYDVHRVLVRSRQMHKRFLSIDSINGRLRLTVYDRLTCWRSMTDLRVIDSGALVVQKKLYVLPDFIGAGTFLRKNTKYSPRMCMYSDEHVRDPRSYRVIESEFSKCDRQRYLNFRKSNWIANRTWKWTRCVNNVAVVKVARVIYRVTMTTRTCITIISSIFCGFFINIFLKLFWIQSETTNNNRKKTLFLLFAIKL